MKGLHEIMHIICSAHVLAASKHFFLLAEIIIILIIITVIISRSVTDTVPYFICSISVKPHWVTLLIKKYF